MNDAFENFIQKAKKTKKLAKYLQEAREWRNQEEKLQDFRNLLIVINCYILRLHGKDIRLNAKTKELILSFCCDCLDCDDEQVRYEIESLLLSSSFAMGIRRTKKFWKRVETEGFPPALAVCIKKIQANNN